MKGIVVCFVAVLFLGACSYLKYASSQAEYRRIQQASPGQVNLKHMIDKETYFVIGQTIDELARFSGSPLVVAAYSSKFKPHERVDTMYLNGSGTHFGLNLPEGDYHILVFADENRDELFDQNEIIGEEVISVGGAENSNRVLGQIEIRLSSAKQVVWVEAIENRTSSNKLEQSVFFPTGSIRGFDDPLFSENMTTLGMYDPASFIEQSPTMFYALEEDVVYKIPVVFVHGAGGSIRDFEFIVSQIDRTRYKPWFFYYPSGGDLDQIAELFHRIFLSGKIIRLGEMPMIIVAHSMGGVLVRESLNKYVESKDGNKISLFVSIASPFGGHPAAALGEKHGIMVLPAWRDLNPEGSFIKKLFREPLPNSVEHQLLYAFDNSATVKVGDNSDGVVPLSSQLRVEAQDEAAGQFGFNASHTGVLMDGNLIAYVFKSMDRVVNPFPQSHLRVLRLGGYDVNLSSYGPESQYVIRNQGKYWMAISNGSLSPVFPEQKRFLRVIHGEEPPKFEVVKDWLRFLEEHPDIDNGQIDN